MTAEGCECDRGVEIGVSGRLCGLPHSMSVVAAGPGDPVPASTSNSRRLGRRSQGRESEHCLQITHTPNRSYDCCITVAYPLSHHQNHRRP
jgi:hypothetical protein